jgi:hypothetical protein
VDIEWLIRTRYYLHVDSPQTGVKSILLARYNVSCTTRNEYCLLGLAQACGRLAPVNDGIAMFSLAYGIWTWDDSLQSTHEYNLKV